LCKVKQFGYERIFNISETAKLLAKAKNFRRWDREGKLLAVREPMSNYRVYRKADVQALFAEFIDSEIIETDINFVNQMISILF
jgi:DNA (cytosine-5)-methyltransferase 1